MHVNDSNTNIVHFRHRGKSLTDHVFKFGTCALQVVNVYQYLGLLFDEFGTFDEAVKVLSGSAGRALGAIIGKFKHVRDIGYKMYTKLYDCGVSPILDYTAEFWGFNTKVHVTRFKNVQ